MSKMPNYKLTRTVIPLTIDRILMGNVEGSLAVMPMSEIEKGTLGPHQESKPSTYLMWLSDSRVYLGAVLVGSPDRKIGDTVQSVAEILYSKDGELFNPLAEPLGLMDGRYSDAQWGIYEIVPEQSATASRS